MKKNFTIVALSMLFILMQSFTNVQPYKLKVKVYNLKNTKGNLVVMIYDKDGTIPDKSFTKYYLKKVVPINSDTAYVEFDQIPQGRYAVNIFHDENANGKLDKGFIKPLEGFGLSNFKKVNLFNKPNFKKASFLVDKDTLVSINLIYL